MARIEDAFSLSAETCAHSRPEGEGTGTTAVEHVVQKECLRRVQQTQQEMDESLDYFRVQAERWRLDEAIRALLGATE